MASFSAEQRQEILTAFQRRQALEFLIAVSFLGGAFVLVQLFSNPNYQVAGFGGSALALMAGAVLLVGLGLHFVNWRCPACGRLLRGLAGTPFCRGCGALFVEDGKGGRATPGDPAEPGLVAEIALQRELDLYRTSAGKLLFKGLVLAGFGVVVVLFFPPDDGASRQNLWLYRTFGESGLVWSARGLGILMTLFGGWMLSTGARRLTTGVRDREASSRRVLGIEGGVSPPQPSRLGFLVALGVIALVVVALCWLSQKLQAM
jgi:hypothetical protein